MKVRNLTPHRIDLVSGKQFPPDGVVARLVRPVTAVGTLFDVDLLTVGAGVVEGLPEPEPGTVYIVSTLAREACPGRRDLVSPGTLLRDGEGRVIGTADLVANGPLEV